MTLPIEFRNLARLDVEETAERFAESDPRVAFRFKKAVRAAADLAAFFPGLGRPVRGRKELFRDARGLILHGFRNYVLYYKLVDGRVIVLRVLHGARNIDLLD